MTAAPAARDGRTGGRAPASGPPRRTGGRGVAEAEISDEEIAEFDRHHAAYMRGDLKGISGKESVKRLRKAQVRDEAL